MDPAVNIARYHAYVACIECRLNYLQVDRDYNGFINNVFPYFCLLFSSNGIILRTRESKAQRMWGFAWDTQNDYLRHLKEKNIGTATDALGNLATLCGQERRARGDMDVATVKKATGILSGLDGEPCDLIARVDALPGNVSVKGWVPTDQAKTVELLSRYNRIAPTLVSFAKSRVRSFPTQLAKDSRLIYPTFLGSELMAWASHLGNSIILMGEAGKQKSLAEREKLELSQKQLRSANEHLGRAVLDVYKFIFINILREKETVVRRMSREFWGNLIRIRRQDHDGEETKNIIDGYHELLSSLMSALGHSMSPVA